jgi:Flp pilus assembly pilin Flp
MNSNSLYCKHIQSRGKAGQTLAEYALILAFISVVAITSLAAMGTQVSSVYTTVNQQLNIANSGGPASVPRSH